MFVRRNSCLEHVLQAFHSRSHAMLQKMNVPHQTHVMNLYLISGFHLSGEVIPGRVTQSQAYTSTEQEIKYKVSVSFDRWEHRSIRELFVYRLLASVSFHNLKVDTAKLRPLNCFRFDILQSDWDAASKFVNVFLSSEAMFQCDVLWLQLGFGSVGQLAYEKFRSLFTACQNVLHSQTRFNLHLFF